MNDFNNKFINVPIEMGNLEIKFIFSDKFLKGKNLIVSLPHTHIFCEMHVIYEGSFRVVTEENSYLLEQGDICIIPANLNHFIEADENIKVRTFNALINFSRRKAENTKYDEYEYYTSFYKSLKKISLIRANDIVQKYLTDFLDVYKSDGIEGTYIAKGMLMLAFIEITRRLEVKDGKANNMFQGRAGFGSVNDDADVRIIKIERYISQNYKENISLRDVANHFYLSEAHTARIIKKQMDTTFSKMVMEMKMSEAKKEILDSDIPLAALAEKLGYNSYYGFFSAFKRYFGISPKEFREENAKDD